MYSIPDKYATTKHLANLLGQSYLEFVENLIKTNFVRETNEGIALTAQGCNSGGILVCDLEENEQILWPTDIIPGVRNSILPKYKSLSALARELNIDPNAARSWLIDSGLLDNSTGKQKLLLRGIEEGAAYKISEKGEKYIVWPPGFPITQYIPAKIINAYPELGRGTLNQKEKPSEDTEMKPNYDEHSPVDSNRVDDTDVKKIDQKAQSTYSVDMVLAAIVNKVSGIVPSYPINVRGTLGKVNSSYDRWIYASLHGSDSKVSLKIPKESGCPVSGSVVTATGILQAGTSRVSGSIEITLLGELLEYAVDDKAKIQNINKREHAQIRLNSYLEMNDGKFRKMCVAGSNTGLSDSETAFQAIGSFPPDWIKYELNMIDQYKILSFLDWILANDEINAICLVRGGGEQKSFEVWETPEVINKLLSIKKPFYSAIGHSTDLLLVDKVADESFTTPTAFGATAANTVQYQSKLASIETELAKKQLLQVELAKLQEQLSSVINEKNTQTSELQKRINSFESEVTRKNELEIETAKLREQINSLQEEKTAVSESIQKRIEELETDRNSQRDNAGKYYEAITKLLSERSLLDDRVAETTRKAEEDRMALAKIRDEKLKVDAILEEYMAKNTSTDAIMTGQTKATSNTLLIAIIVLEAIALVVLILMIF